MSTDARNCPAPSGAPESDPPRRRSGGPRTPWGKARSSRNALKHGKFAKIPVLRTENEAAYHEFVDLYYARFAPASEIERRLVSQLASIDWRISRYINVETRAIDNQLGAIHQNPFSPEASDQLDQTILAINAALDQRALPFAGQRETALVRTREITLRTLMNLRRQHPAHDATPAFLSLPPERTPDLVDSMDPDLETN